MTEIKHSLIAQIKILEYKLTHSPDFSKQLQLAKLKLQYKGLR